MAHSYLSMACLDMLKYRLNLQNVLLRARDDRETFVARGTREGIPRVPLQNPVLETDNI